MPVRSDSSTFRVACSVSIGLSAIRQELATMSQVEIIDLSPRSGGIGSDHECQGLVIYASQFSPLIAGWIQKNPLEWIHLVTAGSDPLDAVKIPDSLHLSSSGHLWADTVAEHALAMLLTLTRGMNVSIQTVQTGQWSREEIIPRLHRIKDLNVLVVGYGRIGSKIGASVKNLGAQVADLDTLIPHADVIFLSVPLNFQTHHLVSKAQFDLMKKSVILINVSRGGILDEEALYRVLVDGKLSGAGLDVFENEPLSLQHPLRSLPNVLLTPHVAGFGEKDIQEAIAKNVRDNLLDILAGRSPRNQINRGPKTL